jgi:hypothetical protein
MQVRLTLATQSTANFIDLARVLKAFSDITTGEAMTIAENLFYGGSGYSRLLDIRSETSPESLAECLKPFGVRSERTI